MREFPVSLVLLHYILFSIREVAEQTEEGGGPRRSKRGRAAGQQDVTPAEPPSAPQAPTRKSLENKTKTLRSLSRIHLEKRNRQPAEDVTSWHGVKRFFWTLYKYV